MESALGVALKIATRKKRQKKTNIYQTARVSGYGKKMEDWLRTTLTTLQAKHAEECYCKDKGVIELIEEAVEAEQIRIARKMVNASIIDEDEVVEEDFEGVSRVDAFMAGITHMHNAFREALTPTKTDKTTEVQEFATTLHTLIERGNVETAMNFIREKSTPTKTDKQ